MKPPALEEDVLKDAAQQGLNVLGIRWQLDGDAASCFKGRRLWWRLWGCHGVYGRQPMFNFARAKSAGGRPLGMEECITRTGARWVLQPKLRDSDPHGFHVAGLTYIDEGVDL